MWGRFDDTIICSSLVMATTIGKKFRECGMTGNCSICLCDEHLRCMQELLTCSTTLQNNGTKRFQTVIDRANLRHTVEKETVLLNSFELFFTASSHVTQMLSLRYMFEWIKSTCGNVAGH